MRVLVSAASRHGSTTEIAEAVGEVLRASGLEVLVTSPEHVDALEGFDALVLGSAVYAGHWLAPALALADRIGEDPRHRPVWLFSSGPVGNPSRRLVQQMGADPVDLARVVTATGAHDHQTFSGKLDRRHLRGLQRVALLAFRGLEGDFRDWQAIRNWAESIARALQAASAA